MIGEIPVELLKKIRLPEVCAFAVEGSNISEEQALAVIVATTNPQEIVDFFPKKKPAFPTISLKYLNNFLFGKPVENFSWCDWDGCVYSDSRNIIGAESVYDIHQEWQRIAELFPFLRLRSQVFTGGIFSKIGILPIVEFQIYSGRLRTFSGKAVKPLFVCEDTPLFAEIPIEKLKRFLKI